MRITSIKMDAAKAAAGIRVPLAEYDPRFEDAWVRVRAFGNADDLKLMDRQNRGRRGSVTSETAYEIMTERLLTAILIDWGGFTDAADQPVPYSRDQAEQWLSDRDYALFRGAVVWAASEVTSGDAKELEDASGN